MIVSALDQNKALDVSQSNNSSKFDLILWDKKGSNNQKFRIQPVAGGRYQIISLVGGTVEVPNGSTGNIQIKTSQQNNVEN